ncbi:hypothetical protein POPTR_004G163600v4 [Populus trichocarpa]|uniref:Uncharacterized protein n=2 Tax=Populus trichocarpa TaxID=3694 RepID=A0ACC0T521_POPTR|nr:polyprenol reductase 2 isoform X1 [Populus trichocarpa]KAI9396639.1 hypothetical protein POPTR_004G163600v4 [Populus trichocarpa]KAI9396640.1 hypothetical protein POPTR_004G163600v4 [Populus trichocarpa]
MELGLVELLRAAWIAGTLPILIASLPCSWLGSFHGLVLGFARRGKIMKSSSHHKFTVPQRFFSHFYVVAVVWTTLLLIATWIYAHRMAPIVSEPFFYSDLGSYLAGRSNTFSFHRSQLINSENKFRVWLSVFLLLLMEVQVLRRLFETLYVFKYSPSARMHIFGYLTGLFFYTAMPLTLCCTCAPNVFKFGTSEVTEFIVKDRSSMQAIEFDWWDFVNPFSKLGWCQWIGAAIFLCGWIHQHRCHAILGSLREHVGKVDEYVIPHGDWFEIVSTPHYLAEIVIYAGVVFGSGGADLTIWLLFGFVVSNLIFAAAETHRWYLQKFDNYPSNRVAIIPFVC